LILFILKNQIGGIYMSKKKVLLITITIFIILFLSTDTFSSKISSEEKFFLALKKALSSK
jgi:hypothetical protein